MHANSDHQGCAMAFFTFDILPGSGGEKRSNNQASVETDFAINYYKLVQQKHLFGKLIFSTFVSSGIASAV
jgi:hypothetical protein